MASRFVKTKLGVGKPQSVYRIFLIHTILCFYLIYIYLLYMCSRGILFRAAQALKLLEFGGFRASKKSLKKIKKSVDFIILSVLLCTSTVSDKGATMPENKRKPCWYAMMQEVAAHRSGKFLRSMSDLQTGRNVSLTERCAIPGRPLRGISMCIAWELPGNMFFRFLNRTGWNTRVGFHEFAARQILRRRSHGS